MTDTTPPTKAPRRRGHATKSRTRPVHLKVNERRFRVYELKRAGASFQQIADKIVPEFGMPKYTKADAYNDLKRLLEETQRQPVDEYRELEVDRLNTAQVAIWGGVLRGDMDAIDTLMKIVTLRAKFQGTFAPVKVAGPDGGPLQIDVVSRIAIQAIVKVIDQLELPPAQRAAVLEQIKGEFLAIEGAVTTEPERNAL